MSEGFLTTIGTAGLAPEQRERVDAQLRSEGIPATWIGELIQVDQAFESRVEGFVATARSTAPPVGAGAPTGFAPTGAAMPGYPTAGYPPAPYPTGYPAGGYGYPMGAPVVTNSNATMSLVLAIIGWAVCPIASIFGVIYARRAQDEIAASGGTQGGEGLAKAGLIISWIIIGIYGAVIVASIVGVIMFAIIAAVA